MTTIDTLAISKRLRAAGFEIAQADGIALVLYQVLTDTGSDGADGVLDLKIRIVQIHGQIKSVLFLLMAGLCLGFALIAIELLVRK